MSDDTTPVPDDEKASQKKLEEGFRELEKDMPDNTEDISEEQFGSTKDS
jgi:hypothetical protein